MSDLTRFKGGAELQAFLDQLPAKMEANVMRSALRAGANVIRDEAKANVSVVSGALRDSIRVSTRSRRGVVSATIKAGNKKAWYYHFVEFGTAAHLVATAKETGWQLVPNKRASSGFAKRLVITKQRGKMHPGARARPFMRPALDSKSNAALNAVGEAIRKRLTKHGINAPDGLEIEDEE